MNFKARLAAQYLNNGGIISIPTDTIQGLSCLPAFTESIYRLLQLKKRSASKGLILLANHIDYFQNFVINPKLLKQIKPNKDNPTTYLVKANEKTSKLLTGKFDTVALRVTNNLLISQLCKMTKSALISTSANISEKKCIDSILDLKINFNSELDFIICPEKHNNKASTIIDLSTNKIIR
jgi:L-threonylcarbamoyladenylate synthase